MNDMINQGFYSTIKGGRFEEALQWLQKGANVNIKIINRQERTFLTGCIRLEQYEKRYLDAFIKFGGDINFQNKEGMTALMYAVQKRNEAAVNDLIEAGADINLKNKDGMTALMYAVQKRNESAINDLIEAGADINLKNKDGKNALFLLAQTGYSDFPCVQKLGGIFLEQKFKTTEDWLEPVVELLIHKFFPNMPKFRLSTDIMYSKGWPKLIDCWDKSYTEDGYYELFIYDSFTGIGLNELNVFDYIALVAHALLHAYVGFQEGHSGVFQQKAKQMGLKQKDDVLWAGKNFIEAIKDDVEKIGDRPKEKSSLNEPEIFLADYKPYRSKQSRDFHIPRRTLETKEFNYTKTRQEWFNEIKTAIANEFFPNMPLTTIQIGCTPFFGCCSYELDIQRIKMAFNLIADDIDYVGIIAHEMIHAFLGEKVPAHGKRFQEECEKIGLIMIQNGGYTVVTPKFIEFITPVLKRIGPRPFKHIRSGCKEDRGSPCIVKHKEKWCLNREYKEDSIRQKKHKNKFFEFINILDDLYFKGLTPKKEIPLIEFYSYKIDIETAQQHVSDLIHIYFKGQAKKEHERIGVLRKKMGNNWYETTALPHFVEKITPILEKFA